MPQIYFHIHWIKLAKKSAYGSNDNKVGYEKASEEEKDSCGKYWPHLKDEICSKKCNNGSECLIGMSRSVITCSCKGIYSRILLVCCIHII